MIKKFLVGFMSVLVVALPMSASAVGNVSIESATMIANVTAGDTQYQKAVNAKVDDVVKVQVWYHNKEEANSGKIAENLKVKIDMPTANGKTQVVNSTVSATNSNTVTDSATANLSLDSAHLEYIPGSAKWRHNKGTNDAPNWVTENISDQVVTGGGQVLENEQPCFNFEATVTVLARVKANAVSITKQVRKVGEKTWATSNTANPGDTLEYLITFKNEGNTVLKNVAIGDNMPAYVTYINGTTMLKNGNHPEGIKIDSDNITKGGILVGDYNPGAVGYVWFQAKVSDSQLKPGCSDLKNVGVVRPEGMNEFYNTATTKVCVNTPTPPTTPPTLPQTGVEGAATGLGGITGSIGIGYAVNAYRKAKRGMQSALRNVR